MVPNVFEPLKFDYLNLTCFHVDLGTAYFGITCTEKVKTKQIALSTETRLCSSVYKHNLNESDTRTQSSLIVHSDEVLRE